MSTESELKRFGGMLVSNTDALNELTLQVHRLSLSGDHDRKLNSMLGEKVDGIETAVFGCVENNVTGLTTKVDRVERSEESRKWNLRAMWAAVIGVAAASIKDLLNMK